MKRWFGRLPIHRKLVVMALLVTTVALAIANTGLMIVDAWRYRAGAFSEAVATARVIAQNTAAAVTFKDPDGAHSTLESVRVRPAVRRACLYLQDGTLFAQFARSPELACPPARPLDTTLDVVVGTAPVASNGRALGTVYVERDLGDLRTRVAVAGLAGLVMLILAAGAAFPIAHRITRMVSRPIAELAAAARAARPDGERFAPPAIDAGNDEVGDLVRAFSDMLRRIQAASAERELLLAREREAGRLKDEFLAAVSHELRTPLNAIMGWVQILTTTAASEQTVARGLASIARNARAQTRVIEDLVDVSRIATGKLTVRFDPLDLREVVENAVDVTRPAAEAKGIGIGLAAPASACPVHGDRDRLQQVIWNLLSNAVKFTPQGGRIDVALVCEAGLCEVSVADTGPGIPAAFLPHVFDRFRQADGSTTREHGGLGLGLAIVKELTELHGGTVRVASGGEGRGSTFTLTLPRVAGPHLADVPPAAHGTPSLLTGVQVLAVDDNDDALDVLVASLSALGARVRTARGGEAAILAWEREPADVLLCDLSMPLSNGFDVLQAVRRRDTAGGRRTPAIAVTAHVSESHRREALEAGFDAHVSKPYDITELARTIARTLHRP